ncbi:hypothetical protein Goari_000208 [Gossypium aridum]|uniref:FCP1 homology domain-containing protein n=1 Tax=Gossypium aridum TaxID=34290 RepID=A0A7J8YFX4_GOSAI|nr:hypothetical protein [Gossypium aridum]
MLPQVVLDLDETLVCAYETSSLPPSLRNQAMDAGLKWFELECVSSDKECEGKPKINYVTVFERPGFADINTLFHFQLITQFSSYVSPRHYLMTFNGCPQAMLDHLLTELMLKTGLVFDSIGLLQLARKYASYVCSFYNLPAYSLCDF